MGITIIGLLTIATALGAENLPLVREKQIGDFTASIHQVTEQDRPLFKSDDYGGDVLEIRRAGRIVYSMAELTRLSLMDTPPEFDFNNDGHEDLLAVSDTGGSHCCTAFIFLEFLNGVREFARVENQKTYPGVVDRVKSHYDLRIVEATFIDWNARGPESAAEPILLCWGGRSVFLDLKAMAGPLPNQSEWNTNVQRVSELLKTAKTTSGEAPAARPKSTQAYDAWWHIPSALTQAMLDLIYTGHPREADQFFNEVWPKSLPGKWAFYADFTKQLHSSPYWPQLCGWCAAKR